MIGDVVPPLDGSALALSTLRLEPGERAALGDADADVLFFVHAGEGSLALAGEHRLGPGSAALVLAGEDAQIAAASGSALDTVVATVGPTADRHAPLGGRERIVRLAEADADAATGARSFQVLFGPRNGSTRATFFVGRIPPGKAPWHYHLYDEIVWVPEGPGRLHLDGGTQDLGAGAAFRLRPRQVHIVESALADRELTVLGVFTPAGSPSAAYLTPDVAATYRFAE